MDQPEQVSPQKVIDIVIDSLQQAMRTADLAFAIAIIAVAVVFAWGLQGDFEEDVRATVAAHQAAASAPASNASPLREAGRPQVEVPVLGFKADLSTAAILGLVCYIIFTIRAGNHVRKARKIAQRLRILDERILDALLTTTPSVATSGRVAQAFLSLTLGSLAFGANGLYLSPINEVIGKPSSQTWLGAAFMLLPAAYLGWQLVTWRKPPRSADAQAAKLPNRELMQQQIQKLNREYSEMIQRGDTAEIEPILADDYVLTDAGGKAFSKAEDLETYKDRQKKIELVETLNQRVRVVGDTVAIANATIKFKGAKDGKPFDVTEQCTTVWMWREGLWQIVSDHISVVK